MKLMNDLVLLEKKKSVDEVTNSGIYAGKTIIETNVFKILDISENLLNEEPTYKIGDNVLLQFFDGTNHSEGMVIHYKAIVAVIE